MVACCFRAGKKRISKICRNIGARYRDAAGAMVK